MAGFADLAARLAQLSKVPSKVSKKVAEELQVLIKAEFDAEQNAYGNAWKPLLPQTVRRKHGDTRILKHTDKLAASPIVRSLPGAGVEIEIDEVGKYHQTGTKHMVARKILPDGSALPKTWQQVIADALAEAMKDNA